MDLLYINKIGSLIFIIMTVIGFLIMGLDKSFAKRGKSRISEKNLLTVAVLAGSIGIICGVYVFRHKTRHLKFKVGVPLIIIAQIIIYTVIVKYLIN